MQNTCTNRWMLWNRQPDASAFLCRLRLNHRTSSRLNGSLRLPSLSYTRRAASRVPGARRTAQMRSRAARELRVPLIQDRTFVPTDIEAQDPFWNHDAGGNAISAAVTGRGGL